MPVTFLKQPSSFENSEAEDNENNHDIQITLNLGSPQTPPVAQPEQSNNKINNTITIETSDKVFRLEGLYKKQSKSIATLTKAVKNLARQMPATKTNDSARSSPEKRRPEKQKRSSTNSFEANSDTEAQLLIYNSRN